VAVLQKVKRGGPVIIPAATFNTFIDAARDFPNRQRSARRAAVREQRDTGIALVRNDSGADRERFDVLGLAGRIIKPTEKADELKNRAASKGVAPTDDHADSFAVLFEPLAAGAIGRPCVDGVSAACVAGVNEPHGFADAVEGVAGVLRSSASGTGRLLWVQPVQPSSVIRRLSDSDLVAIAYPVSCRL
jgi:hypothetical protein